MSVVSEGSASQAIKQGVVYTLLKNIGIAEISGEDAVKYGFATHVSNTPFEDAMKLAEEIASQNPTAIIKAKKMLNEAPYLSAADGLMMESVEQMEVIGKKNQIEAVMAAMQKRPAQFENYRESDNN